MHRPTNLRDRFLASKQTFRILQEDITHAVEKVCSLLPSQYSSECDQLIEQYGPEIISALVEKVPPKSLCSTIGVCSSQLVSAVSFCTLL